ncbi:MAG: GNAT family N-acetyltransferase, partial [Cetobacterium sp.]
MEILIKKFEELTTKELYEILKLRSEVFIVEQACVYNDVDGKDYDSTHIMMLENGVLAAYIRTIPAGISYDSSSFGRVLVREQFRGLNLGRKVVEAAIHYLFNVEGVEAITIGGQHHLEKFYHSFGFKTISEVYLDDNIPHIDMILEKISKQKAKQLFDSGDINKVKIGTFEGLQYIHEYLFGDIYHFAGKIRTVNIAKNNFRFAPLMYLEHSLKYID